MSTITIRDLPFYTWLNPKHKSTWTRLWDALPRGELPQDLRLLRVMDRGELRGRVLRLPGIGLLSWALLQMRLRELDAIEGGPWFEFAE